MKSKKAATDFDRTAAGMYALAMEQALSATLAPQRVKPDVTCAKLDGGCLLYRVPAHRWREKG